MRGRGSEKEKERMEPRGNGETVERGRRWREIDR